MFFHQGGDVRPGTCLSSQSQGQQKCHGVRKIEIKECLFNIIFVSKYQFVVPDRTKIQVTIDLVDQKKSKKWVISDICLFFSAYIFLNGIQILEAFFYTFF